MPAIQMRNTPICDLVTFAGWENIAPIWNPPESVGGRPHSTILSSFSTLSYSLFLFHVDKVISPGFPLDQQETDGASVIHHLLP